MDQVRVHPKQVSKTKIEIIADPKVRGYHDLIVKGGAFYAVYDEESGLWSQDLQKLSELIDLDIDEFMAEYKKPEGFDVQPMYMQSISNGQWNRYISSIKNLADSNITLNQRMIFANEKPVREDYATTQLPYAVEKGDISAYDKLMSTLYAPDEREKLEWGIGALIDGNDIEYIQKMFVIFGDPGTGKSTVLKIMEMMFPGYITYFSSEELGKGYQFATAPFKSSPLIGIEHDGDLSKLWKNTILNEIASHEELIINEKGIRQYTIRPKTMLFMGTNKPVKITDSKSGLIRRLIDITPTGNTLGPDEYMDAMNHIRFELGGIAYHCREVYRKLGRARYDKYIPTEMIAKTNDIYNFVFENLDVFEQGDVELNDAWRLYKAWAEDSNIDTKLKKTEFMYELGSYFDVMDRPDPTKYESTKCVTYRSFKKDKFKSKVEKVGKPKTPKWLELKPNPSNFDKIAQDFPAQYAAKTEIGNPLRKWADVKTTLKDINTHELHWVQVPENLIVIDFDLRGDDGEKSLERNIEAAQQFPPTYAETSKSGNGLHLHYIYDGDVTMLKNLYDVNIEVKVYRGNASLRRKLTACNDLEVAHISSGLPLKGEKTMINNKELKDEQHLRNIIKNALLKRYCPGTKPSIDFICKVLDEAYESGMPYDVKDMQSDIITFASRSTHWADYCLKVVSNMKFQSNTEPEGAPIEDDQPIVFFDVEVFPNLFLISFMEDGKSEVKSWINPPRKAVVDGLFKQKLVGFNNRKYDNHILWAWGALGYDNQQLYNLSKKIVEGDRTACFSQAYNLSYTDIYDFAQKKQSLKKWEIELGIDHHELGMKWDEPVPQDLWPLVQSYCEDDVRATCAVFHHLHEDFVARQALANMSGLTVNDTTNSHSTRIIFGDENNPQSEFNYPNLADMFPGYTFDPYEAKDKKSQYMGEYPGEGGYVWVYGMENGSEDQDYKDMIHPWEKE